MVRGLRLLLLGGLIAMAPIIPLSARDAESVGEVRQQRGLVTALRNMVPRALHLGAPVSRGDRIVTAAKAKVEIEFRDGSTLSVGSDTSVEVVSYAPDVRQQGRLQLLIGIIRTSLSALWRGGFEVQTEAAVASVRSTDWITEARDDRSSVLVISGEVAVTGVTGDTAVLLSEGEGTDVPVGGAPSPPTRWGDARVRDVLARTRVP